MNAFMILSLWMISLPALAKSESEYSRYQIVLDQKFATLRDSKTCRLQYRAKANGIPVTLCLTGAQRFLIKSRLFNAIGRIRHVRRPGLDQDGHSIRILKIKVVDSSNQAHFRIHSKREGWIQWLDGLRIKLADQLKPRDPFGLFRKLIFDEKPSNAKTEEEFRILGWVHHFSAAGIHLYVLIYLMDSLFYFFFRWGFVSVKTGKIFSGFFSTKCGILVWSLSGFRFGWLRPWLVILLRKTLRTIGIKCHWWMPVVIAIFLEEIIFWILPEVIAIDFSDRSVLHGRWHYALAVGGGLAGMEWLKKQSTLSESIENKFFRTSVMQHVAMALGSWWLTAIYDLLVVGFTSVWTPVISLFTLPLITGIIYPASLLNLGLGFPIELVFCDFFQSIKSFQTNLNQFGFYGLIRMDIFSICLGLAFSILALNSNWIKRIGLSLFLVTVILIQGRLGQKEQTTVWQLDVGQGDAAWVRSTHGYQTRNGMIDSGSARAGASQGQWISFFSRNRIKELDWVLFTHLDEDHAGAFEFWVKTLKIRCVVTSQQQWQSENGIKLMTLLKSQGTQTVSTEYEIQNRRCVPFRLLGPTIDRKFKNRTQGSLGNLSMTGIVIPVGQKRIYLNLGDSDHAQESQLATREVIESLRSKDIILKASHHGSKFSSHLGWLRRISPIQVWVSSGMGNTYGHPSRDFLGRVSRLSLPVFRTDMHGTLKLD